MKDNKRIALVSVIATGFAVIIIVCFTLNFKFRSLKTELIKKGAAEYYLDENNKKQFRVFDRYEEKILLPPDDLGDEPLPKLRYGNNNNSNNTDNN